MKHIKNIFTITLITLALTGCEDFLEPNSKSEFVPKDATSLNELLLGEAYLRNDMGGFNIFLGLLDDDIEATPYQIPNDNYDENKYLAGFAWQPDMFKRMESANSGHTNMYEKYYELILGANAVLDYLPEVTDSEDLKNYVKAQAHALRAFYYFNLVNIFGQPYNANPDSLGNAPGVPLKLKSGMEAEENALKRRTVGEVYDQILSDLHAADDIYKSLPENMHNNKKRRVNWPMVQLMLSRTYLYMEKWEEAAKYAKLVMDNKNFKLKDLNEVPTTEVNNEGETVRTYLHYPIADSPETIWMYGSVDDMFGWVHYGAGSTNPKNNNQVMHAYFRASQDLLDTYDTFDLRKERYIVKAAFGSEELVPMAYGKIFVGTEYLPKTSTSDGKFGRCLRLSEAYLNYAEAQAHIGGEGLTEAINTLTTLREHRFDPEDNFYVKVSGQDELIEFIKDERRRELCFEGHRWFDLRRWGMPEIKHVWHTSATKSVEYTLNEKDLMYTVPIPDEALEENPQLVQNELPEIRQGL